MDERISVVVLTYRSEQTVIETLESIKKQTYPHVELVISDDCSPDHTTEVVDAWLEENTDAFEHVVKVYSKVNTGLPGNMNRGYRAATGRYIKFLAADDFIFPRALECYLRGAKSGDKVIPVAKVHLEAEDGRDITSVRDYCERCYAMTEKSQKEQYEKMLVANWMVSPAIDFYEKNVLDEVGGYVEKFRWLEDYPMNLKLLEHGYQFRMIDEEEALVLYRISASSITGAHAKELKRTEMKVFFQMRFWYMVRNGMGWEAIKQSKYWLRILFQK